MASKINSDSVVLIKQDKADVDEFEACGGRAKLEKACEKAGATVLTRLTNKVTHVLMSDAFETTLAVRGDNKGEPRNAKWIEDAPGKGSKDMDMISEKDIKKILAL